MIESNKWPLRLGALALMTAASLGQAGGFEDPLDVAAQKNVLAAKSPLIGVARAGARVVATGPRGVIVYSDDGGKNWVQGQVPVRTDLLAVHFPSPLKGWAVGHGGVVLHTDDGGKNWVRQIDGRQVSKLILAHYATGEAGQNYVKREQSLINGGGTQPFMSVFFETEQRGYVVGTFNRILRTNDGGKTWEPILQRVDNPKELHFYAISAGPDGLYMVGEAGSVWKYDSAADQFVQRPTPYDGTLFGIVVGDRKLVAYGMRGSVFLSKNQGESWQRIDTGGHAGVSGGTLLDDGSVVLVNLAGTVFKSVEGAESFKSFRAPQSMSYFGVTPADQNRLAFVGAEGIRLRGLAEVQAVAAPIRGAASGNAAQ
ncbi:MAG: glycosyl hydrolase [Zoogloea sp.]|nr:glycosyl hydrolase [Zoogloea sp.]